MEERPEQPPEGRLIGLAQKRAKLSGRKAADLAGMSDGRWRQIVSGYQTVSAGVYAPVRGPAETLARMAQAVGVTPQQLEDVDRADAAEELRTLIGHVIRPEGIPSAEAFGTPTVTGHVRAGLGPLQASARGEAKRRPSENPTIAEINERLRRDPELARVMLELLRRSAGQPGKETAKSGQDRISDENEETA